MDDIETILQREYPLVRPYSRYAGLYDDLGQSHFSRIMLLLAERAVQRHLPACHDVLDLACGTGTAAILLAQRGYRVTGVDRSGSMLEIARRKALSAGAEVDFLEQDMTRLQMERSFDLAICFYDSLNYLLDLRDLELAFQNVAGLLKHGGLFVFDMNTEHCLAHDWGNQVVEERCPSALLIHQYSYDPGTRIGTLEILCLVNGEGQVEKFREIHRERGYTRDEVAGALRRAGLSVLEQMAIPDLTPPDDTASRLAWVVRRPCR